MITGWASGIGAESARLSAGHGAGVAIAGSPVLRIDAAGGGERVCSMRIGR